MRQFLPMFFARHISQMHDRRIRNDLRKQNAEKDGHVVRQGYCINYLVKWLSSVKSINLLVHFLKQLTNDQVVKEGYNA